MILTPQALIIHSNCEGESNSGRAGSLGVRANPSSFKLLVTAKSSTDFSKSESNNEMEILQREAGFRSEFSLAVSGAYEWRFLAEGAVNTKKH
jgi:hypothetical protein